MLSLHTVIVLGSLWACGDGEEAPAEPGTLSTEPVEAVVFLDGDEVGTTPWTPSEEAVGQTVVVRANGYESRSAEVGDDDVTIQLSEGCEELLGYDGPLADDHALTPEELVRLPPGRLPILRNEIFARYGRTFSKQRFAQHFERQAWYEPNPNYDDAVLTETDKANAQLIKSFEGDPDRLTERYLERNQFRGKGFTLAFVDASKVMVIKGEDIYESQQAERFWQPRGDWVITWASPEAYRPGAKGARLWKLDRKTGRILQSMPLRPARG